MAGVPGSGCLSSVDPASKHLILRVEIAHLADVARKIEVEDRRVVIATYGVYENVSRLCE